MKNIRWGWILLGGFLAELLIFVVAIPLSLVAGQQSLTYSAPAASFLATLVFGLWIGRKSPQAPLLNGTLVGAAAMLIYLAMTLGRPEPVAYIIAHFLKLAGGAAGGFLALKNSMKRNAPAVSTARPA